MNSSVLLHVNCITLYTMYNTVHSKTCCSKTDKGLLSPLEIISNLKVDAQCDSVQPTPHLARIDLFVLMLNRHILRKPFHRALLQIAIK